MAPKTILLGLGGLLVLYFLYLVVKGTVSRSVAIPAGIAVGLGVLSLEAHPLLALLVGFGAYSFVAKVVETSIKLAATAVILIMFGLVAYGFQTGKLAL